jgi:hypothetical protein
MVEMDTALYYTFSTIAQTLAGVLGLLAAFLALRINAFNHVIYQRMHDLQQRKNWTDSELLGHLWSGNAPAFFSYFRAKLEEVNTEGGIGNSWQQVLDEGDKVLLTQADGLLERRGKLLQEAKYVVVTSAIVIIFSFTVLMVVPCVYNRTGIPILLLVLGWVGAAMCLIWYVRIILTALREI